jgi:hypothetical protein
MNLNAPKGLIMVAVNEGINVEVFIKNHIVFTVKLKGRIITELNHNAVNKK